MKTSIALVALMMAALATGCAGNQESAPPPPEVPESYQGRWAVQGCIQQEGYAPTKIAMEIVDDQLAVTLNEYSDPNCITATKRKTAHYTVESINEKSGTVVVKLKEAFEGEEDDSNAYSTSIKMKLRGDKELQVWNAGRTSSKGETAVTIVEAILGSNGLSLSRLN